ncbi:uncharacterized protein CEXT_531572 [Caerostris extrusa]|uniref:Uncharacterized protein n=1 Tax=Caerostris extrusa TaxID=172846 RepID=A0AAV4WJ47_CAEEX|nr:uncharacterized protein CEXT_531572 [Caerostris extrusa]
MDQEAYRKHVRKIFTPIITSPTRTTTTIQTSNRMPMTMIKNSRIDRRNTHPPPPVSQKPSHSLPQPSEMLMITETRGRKGQASSTYAKDVVKPTPRMPRLPNGLLSSSAQLSTVPAYQCVINELSNRPPHQISPTDSSTLSLRSEYDSSSSSSREFCHRPNKASESGSENRRVTEKDFLLIAPPLRRCEALEQVPALRFHDESVQRRILVCFVETAPRGRLLGKND